MRIIFAGTPDFATTALEAIADVHDVMAVLTQPDRPAGRGKKLVQSPVKSAAQASGIPIHQPTTLKHESSWINELEADVMVVVAYGLLIPKAILQAPKYGCLNIHASLLPRWRGAAPIQRAIEAGDTRTGVGIMAMEETLDTGPVYLELDTPITNEDTAQSLHDKLAQLGAQGILQVLEAFERGKAISPAPQNHECATYAHKLQKSEAEIDWSQSATKLERKIRAFNPWPVCQSWMNGQRVRFWRASVHDSADARSARIGEVIAADAHAIYVNCGEGVLAIYELQKDGGKRLEAKDFVNGFNIEVGDVFIQQ